MRLADDRGVMVTRRPRGPVPIASEQDTTLADRSLSSLTTGAACKPSQQTLMGPCRASPRETTPVGPRRIPIEMRSPTTVGSCTLIDVTWTSI